MLEASYAALGDGRADGRLREQARPTSVRVADEPLEVFLGSAQAAGRGPDPGKKLASSTPPGESVVRVFLKSSAPGDRDQTGQELVPMKSN